MQWVPLFQKKQCFSLAVQLWEGKNTELLVLLPRTLLQGVQLQENLAR